MHPQRLYFSDLDSNGTLELVESHFDAALKKWVPERDLVSMAEAIPSLRAVFKSFAAYGRAGIDDFCGERCPLPFVQAGVMASCAFLNRDGKFELVALPSEGQFFPGFGINVCDLDGDGNEDVFMAQNLFAVQPKASRHDAGRSIWLRGDGTGRFTAVPGQRSGLKIYGEQRGSAVADYDGDGRLDLAVTQNGAQTRLYRNQQARPGYEIRVAHGPGNPAGVGAAIRLVSENNIGPIREVQAGAGYWSQNAAAQIMASRGLATQVWVRWPGGRVTTSAIPAGARKMRITSDGTIVRFD